MRDSIRIVRRGRIVEIDDIKPTETLLDYLRLRERATGTKEGCNEGDCGACTVVIGEWQDGRVAYRPVNSCIQFLGAMDGKEIVTVEDIAWPDGRLHPVQQAIVDAHGAQCGFCTPGIVMSLFALYHQEGREGPPPRDEIVTALAGNLCRCTGYRPIVDAALAAMAEPPADRFVEAMPQTAGLLQFLADGQDVFIGSNSAFFAAPASLSALAQLVMKYPEATLLAGGTDVGLRVTKGLRPISQVIHVGRVAALRQIEDVGDALILGAGVTYEDAASAFADLDPDLGELIRRLGSRQVRAVGTIGGNIANGSPIGDMPPALIALGATLELAHGEDGRALPLEDYFIAYGKQDRQPGEFVAGLLVPKLMSNQVFRAYKITKRFDEDISAVMGAFRFTIDDGVITEARIAFGGMAATPKRALSAEARLVGAQPGRAASWGAAIEALGEDYAPISDMRASAAYRMETAKALLAKALVECAGAPTSRTRVIGRREAPEAEVA
ncbi:xanthine dehydrogenase small subunit [Pleomorphomonas diazotrophica]|uniref:Xanthine dehydrogenase small subunit n=1 Tax=Pleomorphomonas diazotrophica TaxID=1166257 RepID=A0A1I4UAR4_9HYPH|nr:xanthine dehydrogenase small subunit [Pleomorphomonas diazotrophica]PKR91294.1 xanthine dehydrogenase small subunit [Pleomorphomonas diazotrophica]SFM86089.1 xanthine dehydrogenase small subunit [Pleomorphomonas diazotrophica]